MATIARVTGLVLNHNVRSGRTKDTQTPWSRTSVDVLVGGRGVASVDTSTEDWTTKFGAVPAVGRLVDLAVELDVYNGNLQIRPTAIWSDEAAAAVLEALAAS